MENQILDRVINKCGSAKSCLLQIYTYLDTICMSIKMWKLRDCVLLPWHRYLCLNAKQIQYYTQQEKCERVGETFSTWVS